MSKIQLPKNKKLNKQLSITTLIIAITCLAIVPLLIRVIPVENALMSYQWYGGEDILYDTYSLFKSQVLLVLGLLSIIVIIIRQIKFKTYNLKDPVIILVIVFSFITILSQLVSISPTLSNRGMNGRFESTWVWLSYLAIFTAVYGEVWTKEKLKKLGIAFIISNAILVVIGILQYYGLDPVFNSITKPFITSFKMGNAEYVADYTINYKVIVQTLYHYNYVGFYLSLSIPIIISFALYDKNLKHRLGYFLLLALMIFNLLGSSARGGLVGVVASFPLFIIMNKHVLLKNIKIVIAFVVISIIVFVGFEAYTDGFVTSRLISTFTSVEAPNKIQKISIENDSLNFNFDHGNLKVNIFSKTNDSWDAEYIYKDENLDLVQNESNTYYYLDDVALKDVRIYYSTYGDMNLLTFDIYDETWYFAYDEQLALRYINALGKFDTILTPETYGFEGRERLGSARGYIWSRSLPLIVNKPLLGYGADNFPVVFPQQDYVGKYNAYGTKDMLVDKAHNIYIQIAINSGVIALASYLALVIISLFRTSKYILKNHPNSQNVWISATFISIFSYSIAAFFNDSTVQLSSVFWVLLALSLKLVKNDSYNE
jgi:hypothetical protein